jgi:hypothetical protein
MALHNNNNNHEIDIKQINVCYNLIFKDKYKYDVDKKIIKKPIEIKNDAINKNGKWNIGILPIKLPRSANHIHFVKCIMDKLFQTLKSCEMLWKYKPEYNVKVLCKNGDKFEMQLYRNDDCYLFDIQTKQPLMNLTNDVAVFIDKFKENVRTKN